MIRGYPGKALIILALSDITVSGFRASSSNTDGDRPVFSGCFNRTSQYCCEAVIISNIMISRQHNHYPAGVLLLDYYCGKANSSSCIPTAGFQDDVFLRDFRHLLFHDSQMVFCRDDIDVFGSQELFYSINSTLEHGLVPD
jgi:hypothetical protein